MKFQFYRIQTRKKVSKNKTPIVKPVHPVFKNTSKPKCLEESRAGKIKEKEEIVGEKKWTLL